MTPTDTTPPAGSRVLDALPERLYNAILRGPAMKCTPGRSRQRFDLAQLSALDDIEPSAALAALLGEEGTATIRPKFEALPTPNPDPEVEEDPEIKKLREREARKRRAVKRLATIASETDTYLKDTGVYVLYLGYPLLSFRGGAAGGAGPSRVLAPLAFIPVDLTVRQGPRGSIALTCRESGAERLEANVALKTWVEAQMGIPFPELFEDEEGADPLRELTELTAHVAEAMGVKDVPDLTGWPIARVPDTSDLPKEPTILTSAVLGLYHLRHQNTIKDIEEMRTAGELPPTVSPFLTLSEGLTAETEDHSYEDHKQRRTTLPPSAEEHLIDRADPCQRRAVLSARETRGLVVHGPPGTGKSQTITNIVGDYLARGKSVLFVCEKRTALDVVKFRLDAKGLGDLCAVVHDATRDRRDLYMGVRDTLEGLANETVLENAVRERSRIDDEIDRLNEELAGYFEPMSERDEETGLDFHGLVGRWLAAWSASASARGVALDAASLGSVLPEGLMAHEGDLRAAYDRLLAAGIADNPWVEARGVSLDEFLAVPMNEVRDRLARCVESAEVAARANREGLPAYSDAAPLVDQGAYREATLERLERLAAEGAPELRAAVAALDERKTDGLRKALVELEAMRDVAADATPDAELAMSYKSEPLEPKDVAEALGNLKDYAARGGGFLGFFLFGLKKEVKRLLAPFGLPLSTENAARLKTFLQVVHAQNLLRDAIHGRLRPDDIGDLRGGDDLLEAVDRTRALVDFLAELDGNRAAESFRADVRSALHDAAAREKLAGLLRGAKGGAEALAACKKSLADAGLFSELALKGFGDDLRHGRRLDEQATALRDSVDRLENLLRYEAAMASRPAAFDDSMRALAGAGIDADTAWSAIVAGVYRGALDRRMAASPQIARVDESRVDEALGRLGGLILEKNDISCQQIAAQWQQRRKTRLLSGTGNRLNSEGADLRRRLKLRGRHASRIREVIHHGLSIEGGDPLFDLKPVWMTSPETAAQIFPLQPIFDIVIFDEASQCRLEEGVPVLARGRSIVIAGDTKQLPPSRFFESAVTSSADDDGPELSDADAMFEADQSEIEDLLSAALNIEIEQSFLDVHYRSRHPELIEFSNESFYGRRLQAVPEHPNFSPPHPAILLHHAEGIYEDRCNAIEARKVVERVRELLALESPPSVGIACFNLKQKDLIEDELERLAEEDPDFRERLTTARELMRDGTFEGLFVKNLENVQGDERDFILISTTYGPTPQGKFYRRFGPLARAGGGRRLNVLVTRSREQIEIFTSIPSSVYRQDGQRAIPDGGRPNGAYYLMRYLCFADDLTAAHASRSEAEGRQERATESGGRAASEFVDAIGAALRDEHGVDASRYLGNEGFHVDLALADPAQPDRVTVGVLCDVNRYEGAQDRVEWELFKRGILKWKKWELRRLWSPRFLRDPEGVLRELADGAKPKA